MKLTIFSMNRAGEVQDRIGGRESRAKTEPPPRSASTRSPAPAPAHPPEPEDIGSTHLLELRRRILTLLLNLGLVMGLLVFAADLPLMIRSKSWLVIGVSLAVLTALLVAALDSHLPHHLRLGVLLVGIFLNGLASLLDDGLFGSGRLFLLALPLMAAIFTSRRGQITWAAISIGALVLTGIAMILGWVPAPILRPAMENSSTAAWLTAGVNFALLAIAGTASLGLLIKGLERSLEHRRSLTAELDRERSRLESSVAAQTRDLQRRLNQIHTAAEITRSISREMDLDRLLPQVCELMCSRFDLYYVGIFMIEPGRSGDEANRYAVLKAGSGEAGKKMLAAGHRLAVGGGSMIGWAAENLQPRIALDVGAEAVRFNNPHLPKTRSELALPILSAESPTALKDTAGEYRCLGAMTVQSIQEAAFDQDDVVALQAIADSLSAAIENARLFRAMQANLEEIRSLHSQYLQGVWSRAAAERDLTYAFTQGESEAAAAGTPNLLEVPIRLRDQVIGSLTLEADDSAGRYEWKPEDLALAQSVVDQAALAMENARLLEETQHRAEIERTSAGISSRLWANPDVESILRTTLRELGGTLDARDGWIELWPVESQDTQSAAVEALDVRP